MKFRHFLHHTPLYYLLHHANLDGNNSSKSSHQELQQEKYGLHLELEKLETEYQNTIKDLQDDISTLRKQARANDELQVSERVRSRSLREAQQNSDFLLEQVKKVKCSLHI